MSTTRVEELETQDEDAQQPEENTPAASAVLQHVVDAWEEAATGSLAESACTAAVREWEERQPSFRR